MLLQKRKPTVQSPMKGREQACMKENTSNNRHSVLYKPTLEEGNTRVMSPLAQHWSQLLVCSACSSFVELLLPSHNCSEAASCHVHSLLHSRLSWVTPDTWLSSAGCVLGMVCHHLTPHYLTLKNLCWIFVLICQGMKIQYCPLLTLQSTVSVSPPTTSAAFGLPQDIWHTDEINRIHINTLCEEDVRIECWNFAKGLEEKIDGEVNTSIQNSYTFYQIIKRIFQKT